MERRYINLSLVVAFAGVAFFLLLIALDFIPETKGLVFIVSFFVAPLLTLGYFTSYVLSIVYPFTSKFTPKSFLPFTLLTLGILLIIGVSALSEHLKLDLDKRKALIEEIKKDKFEIENGRITLPAEFEELSIDKQVTIEKHKEATFTVEFYNESLPVDNFTTLHYTNNVEKIGQFEGYIQENKDYCKKVEEGWYFLFH